MRVMYLAIRLCIMVCVVPNIEIFIHIFVARHPPFPLSSFKKRIFKARNKKERRKEKEEKQEKKEKKNTHTHTQHDC